MVTVTSTRSHIRNFRQTPFSNRSGFYTHTTPWRCSHLESFRLRCATVHTTHGNGRILAKSKTVSVNLFAPEYPYHPAASLRSPLVNFHHAREFFNVLGSRNYAAASEASQTVQDESSSGLESTEAHLLDRDEYFRRNNVTFTRRPDFQDKLLSYWQNKGYCKLEMLHKVERGLDPRLSTHGLTFHMLGEDTICVMPPVVEKGHPKTVFKSLIEVLKERGIWDRLLSIDCPAHVLRDIDIEHFDSLMKQKIFKVEFVYSRKKSGFGCEATLHLNDLKTITVFTKASKCIYTRRDASWQFIPHLKKAGLWDKLPPPKYPKITVQPAKIDTLTKSTPPIMTASESESHLEPNLTQQPLDAINTSLEADPKMESHQLETSLAETSMDAVDMPSNPNQQLVEIHQFECLWAQKYFKVNMKPNEGVLEVTVSHRDIDKPIKVRKTIFGKLRTTTVKAAIAKVISKFKAAGVWDEMVRAGFYQAQLDADADLIWIMKWASDELSKAQVTVKELGMRRKQSKRRQSLMITREIRMKQKERSKLLTLKQKLGGSSIELESQDILPVKSFQEKILNMVNDHTYSVVVAATGSGKSSQIPQIILDSAISEGKGGMCRILCVQPRRIAATMLAQRVAEERNEKIGDTVGYELRGDRQSANDHGSITYCTTGIALNKVQSNQRLEYSHIILDEVHVRDMDIDFTMLLLKQYVQRCQKENITAPKIVIMSATVDVDLFTYYFSSQGPNDTLLPAPYLVIPGRHHHVTKYYLDDVLQKMENFYSPDAISGYLAATDTSQFLQDHYNHFGSGEELDNHDESTEVKLDPQRRPTEMTNFIPFGLIVATIIQILSTTRSGSILVFLPGLAHIFQLEKELLNFASQSNIDFSDEDRIILLKLHSNLPNEMGKLTNSAKPGCRRIFLSTDIAEASLTITDLKYVLDTGKVNQKSFDHRFGTTQFNCSWISKSSTTQRAGRAGRVQPGEYYFFGTKNCYASLPINQIPEIMRLDLEEVALRSKKVNPDVPIAEVLQQAIEPPNNDRVLVAIESLKQLQALDEDEKLTSLGEIICRMAINPRLAKLLILGIIFRCLDPLLITVLQEDGYSIFKRGIIDQSELHQSRTFFSELSHSDHISAINAFIALRKVWHKEGKRKLWEFGDSHHLHVNTFLEKFRDAKHHFGVLATLKLTDFTAFTDKKTLQFGGIHLNANSHNTSLVKALILHCMYPRVAALDPIQYWSVTSYFSPSGPTRPHPRSVLSPAPDVAEALRSRPSTILDPGTSSTAPYPSGLLVYSIKFSRANLKQATVENSVVSPLIMSLFGGKLKADGNILDIDSWLRINFVHKEESPSSTRQDAVQSLLDLNKVINTSLAAAYSSLKPGQWANAELTSAREDLLKLLEYSVVQILARDRCLDTMRLSQPKSWDKHDLHHYDDLENDASWDLQYEEMENTEPT